VFRLLRPASFWATVPLAFAVGLAYAIVLFGPGVAFGISDYWRLPQGAIGGLEDMRTAMSGYYWFVQDAWHWPLFHIVQADPPSGANAALTDCVPILALVAKLIRSLTGVVLNLYPLWIVLSFALNAAALTTLVRALGQRSVLAALLAGAMGALSPVIHHRFGHFALMAHWVFIFPLAVYAKWRAGRRGAVGAGVLLVVLCCLGFAVHLYLYVMAAAVAAAFFLQAAVERRLSPLAALAGVLCVLGAGVLPLWAFGMLDGLSQGGVTVPFGQDSMNLLAPFWPQRSGALGWTGLYLLTRNSIGATNGQYEGYSYLGLGALLLVVIAAVQCGRALHGLLRRNWALALALLTLTAWAISNRIYLGAVLVASYPLPDWLLTTVLAWFRASGRFFWPVAWLLLALGITGTLASLRPRAATCVVVLALALQWVDLSAWRARLHGLVTEPPVSAFGSLAASGTLEAEIARRGRVAVVPSIFCNADGGGDYSAPGNIAAAEVQLLAARANATMPGIYLSHGGTDCAAERATPLRVLAGSGVLIALTQPGELDRTEDARRMLACRAVSVGLVCVAPAATP
jgi:Family of unknown function (DUF6311)